MVNLSVDPASSHYISIGTATPESGAFAQNMDS
jgi:hypothetical protein